MIRVDQHLPIASGLVLAMMIDRGSVMNFRVILFSAVMIMAGCSSSVVQRIDDPDRLPLPPPKRGFLKLPQGPDTARIYIDEKFMGRFVDYPRRTLLLPIGIHRVQLTAHGYSTIYARIKVSSDTPVTLEGRLLRLPSSIQSTMPSHTTLRDLQ